MEYSNLGKKRGKGTSLYGSVIEGADYLLDMEMSNQREKRIRADVKDSRCDEKYLSFLVDLEDYWEAKFVEENDEDDPLYAMFLENLKEHGKCYMLDVSVEHGVCSPIMYEVETDPLVVARRKSLRTCQGTGITKEERLHVDRQLKSGQKDSSSNKEQKLGVKKHGFVSEAETSRTRHGYNMRNKKGLETDSQPKSSVKNSAFVCNVETDPLDEIGGTSISCQGSYIRKEGSSGVNRELKCGVKNSGFVNEDEGDGFQVIKRRSSRTRQDRNIQKNGDLCADRMGKSGCDLQEKRAREPDETYKSFFAGLKVIGDSMLYEFGDHHQIFYEGSVQHTSTDTEIEAAPSPPTLPPRMPNSRAPPSLTTLTPLSPTANQNLLNTSVTDKAHDKNGKDSQKYHSKLWRELRRILKKPFDQSEFDELWKIASYRSQVQIYRDSRSGGTYRPGHLGDSYLDKFPELNDEIQKVKSDSFKVLNLLRMLFFYLKMLPHGIPRPWMPNFLKMFLT